MFSSKNKKGNKGKHIQAEIFQQEKPLKSLNELKQEHDDLKIKYDAMLREKELLERLMAENKHDTKRLNSYKRKNYFFAFFALVMALGLVAIGAFVLKAYDFYLMILPIFFVIISYSYSRKVRAVFVFLSMIGVGVYYALCLNTNLDNSLILTNLMTKLNLENKLTATCFNNISPIVIISIPLGIIISSFRYTLSMGNVFIGQRNGLGFFLKKIPLVIISWVLGSLFIIGILVGITSFIDSQNIHLWKLDTLTLATSCTAMIILLLSYLLSKNTFSLKKRSKTKLEVIN